MDIREFVIEKAKAATAELFRQARFVPADKIEWQPGPDSRSVLDIVAECALSPGWVTEVIEKGGFVPDPEMFEKFYAAKRAIRTIDEAEATANAKLEEMAASVRSFPSERLSETVEIPFGPNPNWQWVDLMGIHTWNCTYHTGQVNYIQTMYGDKENH